MKRRKNSAARSSSEDSSVDSSDSDDADTRTRKEKREKRCQSPPRETSRPSSSSDTGTSNTSELRQKQAAGPVLPPGVTLKKGPWTPPVLEGPALPPGFTREPCTDDDVIGPMPFAGAEQPSTVAEDIERRSKEMQEKLLNKDKPKVPKRETWMTEIPEVASILGLAPRKLTGSSVPKDRDTSSWTDTPADRERKEQEKRDGKVPVDTSFDNLERKVTSQRDNKLAKEISKYNESHRCESLLAMHRKKLAKEKKKKEKKAKKKKKKGDKEDDAPKRVPFDRDVDLKLNFMDDAKRKDLIKRSSELGSRFGHGSQKFV